MRKMKVVFFQRKPRKTGNFSLEFIFNDVRTRLTQKIDSVVAVSRFESTGIFKRLFNILEASFRQGEVNHVTGDVNFLAILLNRKKTILTIHDCYLMHVKTGLSRFIYKKLFLDWPVKRAGYITAVSEATKNEIIRFTGCPAKKITIIPSFISKRYRPHPKKLNKEKPVLLAIGTAENKNLLRLIEAVKGLPCRLSIVGKLSEAQKKALAKNGVEYSNAYSISDEEMKAQYHCCDIMTFPSTYEGFGMPILEANAVGRTVLTSRVSSMPYVAGDAACLVDPFDTGSIREGIEKIIHDDNYRQGLIENGYKNTARFAPDRIADMYYGLYQKIHQANAR
ncbi:MAG: glycosyltransferase family 4 protein [Saprospiraceae bacterium]